eukprot:9466297-Pyramimonas_sp.AAC.2
MPTKTDPGPAERLLGGPHTSLSCSLIQLIIDGAGAARGDKFRARKGRSVPILGWWGWLLLLLPAARSALLAASARACAVRVASACAASATSAPAPVLATGLAAAAGYAPAACTVRTAAPLPPAGNPTADTARRRSLPGREVSAVAAAAAAGSSAALGRRSSPPATRAS